MQLRVAMHCHTRRSDGTMAPNDVIRRHHEMGYDAIAITDHDLDLTHHEHRQLDIPEGMLVLRGNEVSFRELYWQHVNHIYGESKSLRVLNHPARYGMTTDQIHKAMIEHRFDAFEITNQGIYCPQYERLDMPRLASDNSHNESMIGRSWMMVEATERSADGIIDAIVNRRVELVTGQKR